MNNIRPAGQMWAMECLSSQKFELCTPCKINEMNQYLILLSRVHIILQNLCPIGVGNKSLPFALALLRWTEILGEVCPNVPSALRPGRQPVESQTFCTF